MKNEEIIRRILDAFDFAGMDYAFVGSFASTTYSFPRSTNDADFLVQIKQGQLTSLMSKLVPEFILDPQMQFETVTGTSKNVIYEPVSEFIIELFELSSDPHDQMRFARRKQFEIYDHAAWIITAEDVLVTKLRWGVLAKRKKDLSDIESVITVQGDAIDWPYVEKWCDLHGSRKLLEEIREELRRE